MFLSFSRLLLRQRRWAGLQERLTFGCPFCIFSMENQVIRNSGSLCHDVLMLWGEISSEAECSKGMWELCFCLAIFDSQLLLFILRLLWHIMALEKLVNVITGDHSYKIGHSLMSHSFQNNVGILTKFSRFIAWTVEVAHTKKMSLGHLDLFQSLKMSDSSIPDIRRLIKKKCVGENPSVPSSTPFWV